MPSTAARSLALVTHLRLSYSTIPAVINHLILLTFPIFARRHVCFFLRGKRRNARSNLLKARVLALRYAQKKKTESLNCGRTGIVGKLNAETLTNSVNLAIFRLRET